MYIHIHTLRFFPFDIVCKTPRGTYFQTSNLSLIKICMLPAYAILHNHCPYVSLRVKQILGIINVCGIINYNLYQRHKVNLVTLRMGWDIQFHELYYFLIDH